MKKVLLLLVVVMMIIGITGCKSEEEKGKGTEEVIEKTAEKSNELTVWCWDPAFNIYAMEEAAKVYQEKNPDFVLNIVETSWDDVQTKMTTVATSGQLETLPDIILMQDNAFQKNHANFPEVFTDLTNTDIDFSQFASAKVAYSVIDDKNYGVPFDNGTSIMALRTDILEEAGLTVEDFKDITWDQYIELGVIVLEKTGLPMMGTQAGSPDLVTQMMQSCGESLFNADGSPNIVGNEALKEAMSVYNDMVLKGILVEVNDWDQYIGTISNATTAGTMNGCWILASIQATPDQSGKWALTNCPKLNDVPGATNYTNNGGSSWLVTSNCQDFDLAVDFFAHTFAGSVAFYETILPSSGALSTYLPAGEGEVYGQPSEFFGGQKIFSEITEFAGKVPSNNTGVYYYEARDAVGVAITNIIAGGNIADEIQVAEDTVRFQMGE